MVLCEQSRNKQENSKPERLIETLVIIVTRTLKMYTMTDTQLTILVLLLCITLAYCCAKQTPPNFGVPVYSPSGENDENRTKQKETQSRQERSIPDTYEDMWDQYSQEDSEVLNENMLKVLKSIMNKRQESSSRIFNVIRGIISGHKNKNELLHNRPSSKRMLTENTNDMQQYALQSQNLRDRIKRSASKPNRTQPSTDRDNYLEEESENQDLNTGGWNTAAAVTGFVLAAVMLLGVTCFVR